MTKLTKQEMDEMFGGFCGVLSKNKPLNIGDGIYKHLFRRFRDFFATGARNVATSVGLLNVIESLELIENFKETYFLNPHGIGLSQMVERGLSNFSGMAFGAPDDTGKYKRSDAIVSVNTLNFFDDPQAVVRAMAASLTPGGRVYLAVQNAASGSRRIAKSMGILKSLSELSAQEVAWNQRRFLDMDGLKELVRNAGLKEIAVGGAMLKIQTDSQLTHLIKNGLASEGYVDGLFELGEEYPELCQTIYIVAEREPAHG